MKVVSELIALKENSNFPNFEKSFFVLKCIYTRNMGISSTQKCEKFLCSEFSHQMYQMNLRVLLQIVVSFFRMYTKYAVGNS